MRYKVEIKKEKKYTKINDIKSKTGRSFLASIQRKW